MQKAHALSYLQGPLKFPAHWEALAGCSSMKLLVASDVGVWSQLCHYVAVCSLSVTSKTKDNIRMSTEALQNVYFSQKGLKTMLLLIFIALDSHWSAHVRTLEDDGMTAFPYAFAYC